MRTAGIRRTLTVVLSILSDFSLRSQDLIRGGVVYTPWRVGNGMAKNTTDLILRDRLQFTLDALGNQATVYGRFDLSDYTSALERKGLSIKEVQFMLRAPTNPSLANTGIWDQISRLSQDGNPTQTLDGGMKIYATTRAYESADTVGIASPDVICIEEYLSYTGPYDVATGLSGEHTLFHNKYGTPDLHPNGFPVVTDLLIGVATDGWVINADVTLELDVMLIASPITITQKQLTEMLVQGQDQ